MVIVGKSIQIWIVFIYKYYMTSDDKIKKIIRSYLNKTLLNESIDIKEHKGLNLAILFTDMVDSSKGWKNHPNEMIKAIEDQSKVIDKHSENNKGFICKTIGDAYMISFTDIKNAIQCGIDIQEDLKSNPINITKSTKVQLRIGICYGPVYESKVNVQNKTLIDYFGNTVNTASRIESNVSDPGSLAYGITPNTGKVNLDHLLKDRQVDLVSFNNKGDDIKRSSRTLTEIHRHIYKSIKALKGVEKIDVFKIKI